MPHDPGLVEQRFERALDNTQAFFMLKDLADVLELVRAAKLPADLSANLNPYVRDKYLELWRAAQGEDPE